MRFCLSSTQSQEYLKKADETMVPFKDHNFIYDLKKINPDIIITLVIQPLTKVDWQILEQYKVICEDKIRIASIDNIILQEAKDHNFKFFSLLPVNNGYYLFSLIHFGVCAVRISGELAHNLDLLKTINIEKRVIANIPGNLFEFNPIIGSWFRPEEIATIEEIDVCEFQAINITQEQALYRIYAERKEWPGYLSELIIGLNDNKILNRMLPPEFSEQRLHCKQMCMNGSTCKYCERATSIATVEFIEKLKEIQEQN